MNIKDVTLNIKHSSKVPPKGDLGGCLSPPLEGEAGRGLSRIFDSFQYRNFRLYFIGQCLSQIGTWMQQIAMGWLIYSLTGDVLMLGTVMFLTQIPMMFLTPFLSTLVDRFNKRSILLIEQSCAMCLAATLAILFFTGDIQIWHIMVLSVCSGCINAIDMPTRQAFYITLVPPEKLSNAIALNSAIINSARLLGPALGGLLIPIISEGGCFLLNAVSYVCVLIALAKIDYAHVVQSNKKFSIFSDFKEGVSYISHSVPIRTLLITVSIFSFCVFTFTTFVPAYIKDILGGDSRYLGFFMSCFGIGSFSAAMFLAARKSVLGLGKVVTICMLMSSIVVIPLFHVHIIWVALIFAVFLGFGLIGTVASCNTLIQTILTPSMRGRVMGYYSMGFLGSGALGSLWWGWVSKFTSLPIAMGISGGICIVVAVVFARSLPKIRKHARPIYVEKGIIPEIAEGIRE
ncbi:MAG: MFS transporter [Bacteroidetes bacterium]|nr:MFS transporter [Bacteroidota bacterium]